MVEAEALSRANPCNSGSMVAAQEDPATRTTSKAEIRNILLFLNRLTFELLGLFQALRRTQESWFFQLDEAIPGQNIENDFAGGTKSNNAANHAARLSPHSL